MQPATDGQILGPATDEGRRILGRDCIELAAEIISEQSED